MKVVWGSLMQDGEAGGYGRVGMRLARAIDEYVPDIELADRFTLEYDWRILVAIPYNWAIGAQMQPDLIWHTMVECRPLPEAMIPLYNRARHIWVPSHFVKDVIHESAPGVPVLVSGYGMDASRYPFIDREDEAMPGHRGDRPFRFFVWTDTIPTRKGAVDAMWAFDKLQLPDCEMVVKVSQDKIPLSTANERIRFLHGTFPWHELLQVMGMCDVMVYPSRGEGFGLMPLECMATGMCTIVPKASGMAEYVRDEYNLVLPIIGEERVVTSSASYECDQYGHKPDRNALVDMMLWCYNNQHEAYKIGRKASEYAHSEWTWERAAHRAADILRPLGSWHDGL
jgi:glycosyltransferase involved in cell wall biosynthesis